MMNKPEFEIIQFDDQLFTVTASCPNDCDGHCGTVCPGDCKAECTNDCETDGGCPWNA